MGDRQTALSAGFIYCAVLAGTALAQPGEVVRVGDPLSIEIPSIGSTLASPRHRLEGISPLDLSPGPTRLILEKARPGACPGEVICVGDSVRIRAIASGLYWSAPNARIRAPLVGESVDMAAEFVAYSGSLPVGRPIAFDTPVKLRLADSDSWVTVPEARGWIALGSATDSTAMHFARTAPDGPPTGSEQTKLRDGALLADCQAAIPTMKVVPAFSGSKLLAEATRRATGLGSPNASAIVTGSRVRWDGLAFQACSKESAANRRVTAQLVLRQLFFDPAPDSATALEYSWRPVREAEIDSGVYRLQMQLYADNLPVFDVTAFVDILGSNVATSVSSVLLTSESNDSIHDARLASEMPKAEVERSLKRNLPDTAFDDLSLGLLKTEGVYRKVYLARQGLDRSVASPRSATLDATSGHVLTTRRSGPDRAGPDTTSVKAWGQDGHAEIKVTCNDGMEKCGLVGATVLPLRRPRNPAVQQKLQVRIGNSQLVKPKLEDFQTLKEDYERAAVDANANLWLVLNTVASKLDLCGFDDRCTEITSEIRLNSTEPAFREESGHLVFGRASDSKAFGSGELAVVAHEFVHNIVRANVDRTTGFSSTEYRDCAADLGQPFLSLDESIADTLGMLIASLARGTEVADAFGAGVMGRRKRQFRLSSSWPGPVDSSAYLAAAKQRKFAPAWERDGYRLPLRVQELVLAPCEDEADRRQFDVIKYYNVGVPNAVAAQLIDLEPDKRPYSWRSDPQWRTFLAAVYLKTAQEMTCHGKDACENYCTFKTTLLGSIKTLARAEYAQTHAAAARAFSKAGITAPLCD